MFDVQVIFTAHRREMIFSAILFVIATFCFALGYESDQEFNGAPIVIEKCAAIPASSTVHQ